MQLNTIKAVEIAHADDHAVYKLYTLTHFPGKQRKGGNREDH